MRIDLTGLEIDVPEFDELRQEVLKMSAELDALTAKVQELSNTVANAVEAIGMLAAQVAAGAVDAAQLTNLTAQIQNSITTLSDALNAITPPAS